MEVGHNEKHTVLLVDDDSSLRLILGQMLDMVGYRVLPAETGRKALELYQQEADNISVVVMDLMLPDMYGTECLRGLLDTNPRAKVIVCSGQSGITETNEVIEKGATAFLEKPVTTDQLDSAIRRAIVES